jgi:Galactosyltransferase
MPYPKVPLTRLILTREHTPQGNQPLHVQTKPSSQDHEAPERRKAIRGTWLPRVQELPGVTAKFVVGKASDTADEAALQREIQQYPDEFLVLDVHVCPLFPCVDLTASPHQCPRHDTEHISKQRYNTTIHTRHDMWSCFYRSSCCVSLQGSWIVLPASRNTNQQCGTILVILHFEFLDSRKPRHQLYANHAVLMLFRIVNTHHLLIWAVSTFTGRPAICT